MKIFNQKNNFSLCPIVNSINMSPLKAISPIGGFNNIEKYDLGEVDYKQRYTNEEENNFSYSFLDLPI